MNRLMVYRFPRAFSILAALVVVVGHVGRASGAQPGAGTIACDAAVETEAGFISGIDDPETEGVCAYRGVPYAAPPIGRRRWRAPERPLAWEGLRSGAEFGPRCMQKGVMEIVNADPSGRMSEDCLTLNIWRPSEEGVYPVYVFFHGGGLYGGTANTPVYHGDRLSARGIVVVTVNYRLNIFGYLALEALAEEDSHGSTGNYGLLDQIASLRWVRDNIAAFGGDPDRVTIGGESAGGWSVCALMTSPPAQGLFDQAIIESGGCHTATSMARGIELGLRTADILGCDPDDLECLRRAPARRVLRKAVRTELAGWEWMPRIDGYVLDRKPIEAIRAGEYGHVPLLAGTNRNEADIAVNRYPLWRYATARAFERLLEDQFGPEEARTVAELYLADAKGKRRAAFSRIASENALICPTVNGARALAREQDEVWLYRFDYHGFRFGRLVGAFHGSELGFVFGTFDRPFAALAVPRRRLADVRALSDEIQRYWSHFIRMGTPAVKGPSEWPTLAEGGAFRILGTHSRIASLDEATLDRCRYWDGFADKHEWIAETMGLFGRKPGIRRSSRDASQSSVGTLIQKR